METDTVKKQLMTLENRERFTVGLVENVESFSETAVVLKTGLGGLHISGKNLKLEDLSINNGDIVMTGRVDSIEYVGIKEKHSFFRDLFR